MINIQPNKPINIKKMEGTNSNVRTQFNKITNQKITKMRMGQCLGDYVMKNVQQKNQM